MPPIRVHGGRGVQEKFMILQDKYQAMINAVESLLMKNSFISIKKYLEQCRREIPPADIEKCTDERLLLDLVIERCSIAQCYYLKLMAEHFNSKQALKHIEKYKSYQDELYSEIKATEFSKILFCEQKFLGEIQVSPQYIIDSCNVNVVMLGNIYSPMGQ